MMRLYLLLGMALLLLTGCNDQESSNIDREATMEDCKTITPERAQELLDKNKPVQILDTRTAAEYYEHHIPDALLMDITDEVDFRKSLAQLSKDKTYIVYCKTGPRSRKACAILREEGFNPVYLLEGGYLAWPQPR